MFLSTTLAIALQVAAGQSGPERLECNAGPVVHEFGGNDWLVYACTDARSFVVVSSAESPANPFVFTFFFDGETYRVRGEGNGDQGASSAAFDELSQLTPEEISNIVSVAGGASDGAVSAAQK